MKPIKRFLFCSLLLCCASHVSHGFADKRAITEKDLFEFSWIADPQISPDGTRVVYVRVTVNDKKDGYDTTLWNIATSGNEGPTKLTNGTHDSAPRWSPNGKRIAFLRSLEKDGKPEPAQIAILPLSGGEAFLITNLPKGSGRPTWSPDGKKIAFSSTTTREDIEKAKRDAKAKETAARSESSAEHESDVRIITRAIYRSNSSGYLDPKRHSHLWVLAAPSDSQEMTTPKMLTSGEFDEGEITWSSDSSKIYFTSSHVLEPYYELPQTELYSLPAEGGEIQKLATIDGRITDFALSSDGKRAAFISQTTKPITSYTQPDLFVIDLVPGGTAKNLTAKFDYDVASGVGGDQAPPRAAAPSQPIWAGDGKSIIEIAGKEGRANLYRFDVASGSVSAITKGDQDVSSFRSSADGSKTVVLVSTPTTIGDLFMLDANGIQRQITHNNEKLFSQLNLTAPEEIWYASFDGRKIQAWVQKPPDFDPKKKYPLILDIHGGPHSAYGYTFDHEFQWMAAKGYVVLYPNPRGSTTYGQEFGNIIQYRYPGDDFKDLMAGVDEVIKRGYIDDKKLGVTGGSGGGLLTNWVITQTDRFAAAVAQRDIADWTSWWYTADFTLFQPNWFRAAPWQDPKDYAARSPITYIERVKTPLMLVLGEADYRTPTSSGGEQMFRALKFMKKPVVMVRFPNESHELSRSGQPWHRVERLQHIVNWFDKYLQGKSITVYDLRPEKETASPSNLPAPPGDKRQ